MKKILSICFLFISAASLIFANNVSLYGASMDARCVISQNGGVVNQTITAADGANYQLSAVKTNNNISYRLSVKDVTDYTFLNNSNFITVYQGNYSKNSWSKMNYTIDPVEPVSPGTTTTAKADDDSLSAVEFCIIAGTVCLCSIALWEMCDDGATIIDPVPAPHHHHHGPTVIVDPIDLTTDTTVRNVNPVQENNVLMNQAGGYYDYSLAFHTSAGRGPDYKVTINTGTELLEYYFLTSTPAATYNGNNGYGTNTVPQTVPTPLPVVAPVKVKDDKHSIVATMSLPEINRYGLTYIYGGDPIGMYLGFEVEPVYNQIDVDGTTTNHNYTSVKNASTGKQYKFTQTGEPVDSLISLNVGLDVQLTNFMWLMGGCGFEFNNTYRSGNLQNSEDGTNPGVISDYYMGYVPQIGVNFVFDHFDIGGLFSYWPETGFRGDIMIGVSF